MKFSEIPKLTRSASYRVHQSWKYLDETLERYQSEEYSAKLDIDPEFQRGHVWTKNAHGTDTFNDELQQAV